MVEKGQWVALPYSVAKGLPGLRLSVPGVKVEQDRRPHWLGNYIHFKTDAKTLPVACLSAMQYGRALDRLLREIVFADPDLGYVHLFYRPTSPMGFTASGYAQKMRPSWA